MIEIGPHLYGLLSSAGGFIVFAFFLWLVFGRD